MKILFLTQTYPRFEGDTSGPFIRDLARGLVRGGDSVTVLAPHTRDLAAGWDDGGVEVRTFRYAPQGLEQIGYSRSLEKDETLRPMAALMTPLYFLAARRAIRRMLAEGTGFDLLHAHWVVPNGLVAAPLARRLPVAVGLHGSDVFLAEKKGVRGWVGRALSRSALLTGCSPELVERVRALGFPEERSRVIPYGVDVEAFSPDPRRRRIWRDELGIPEAAPMVVSVGRMATKKGFQVLLQGLDTLFQRCPDLHLVLAGGGDRLAEFEALAQPFAQRVHFPGAVYRDTLPDLYRAADLFVLPAVHDPKGNVDGLPNVILEAMASGLPVIASGISGIPLAVREGENGHLVPEQEVEPLIAALAALAGSPERCRKMGEASRRRAVRDLTWDAVAARYREGYEMALAGC